MAGKNEEALGIAIALRSEYAPNPPPISFQGQTLSEAGAIVIAELVKCQDANISLVRVTMDPELQSEVASRALGLNVEIVGDRELQGEMRFYR